MASNIFWENHDQSLARSGFAIFSANANKINDAEQPVLRQRRQRRLADRRRSTPFRTGSTRWLSGTTATDAINNLGNFVGNPAFVFPIDPRPGSDGPANFFLDADFQLTSASAAIDNAWEATAVTTDLLGNSQVKINGGGFG